MSRDAASGISSGRLQACLDPVLTSLVARRKPRHTPSICPKALPLCSNALGSALLLAGTLVGVLRDVNRQPLQTATLHFWRRGRRSSFAHRPILREQTTEASGAAPGHRQHKGPGVDDGRRQHKATDEMLAAANWIVLRLREHENLIDIAAVNLAVLGMR